MPSTAPALVPPMAMWAPAVIVLVEAPLKMVPARMILHPCALMAMATASSSDIEISRLVVALQGDAIAPPVRLSRDGTSSCPGARRRPGGYETLRKRPHRVPPSDGPSPHPLL